MSAHVLKIALFITQAFGHRRLPLKKIKVTIFQAIERLRFDIHESRVEAARRTPIDASEMYIILTYHQGVI